MLIAVASWGAFKGSRQGALGGLLGGAALDLLASTPFGLHALLLVPVGLLGAFGEFYLEHNNLLRPLVAVFAGTLVYDALLFLALQFMGAQGEWTVLFVQIALPSAIVNTVLTPAVYWVLERLSRLGRRQEVIVWEG